MMCQNHQSKGRSSVNILSGICSRIRGAYIEILVHLVDEFVLRISQRAHQITTGRSVTGHILGGRDNLRVSLAISALGRCPGPGTCPGCGVSVVVLRILYDIQVLARSLAMIIGPVHHSPLPSTLITCFAPAARIPLMAAWFRETTSAVDMVLYLCRHN